MSKSGTFDMSVMADKIKKHFAVDKKDPELARKIGVGTNLTKPTEGSCIEMPDWWKKATNTKGLYFGRMVMLAGDSDSGKTSAGAITAMKAAIDQGYAVIYIETENKTTTEDLTNWGVDPSKVLLAKSAIAEEAFEMMFTCWDMMKQTYPNTKILIVFDSLGNTVSLRDSEIDLVEENQKPGGKGSINRLAINKMVSKMVQDEVAILIVNYTYDNMGSHGKTNAGGKAVNFFSSLTYQTSRVEWLEKTVDKKTYRKGAVVRWVLYKNHIDKTNPGLKEFFLEITADGVKLIDKKEKKPKVELVTQEAAAEPISFVIEEADRPD